MDKKELESKKLSELKEIAKTLGINKAETLKKADLVAAIAGDAPKAVEAATQTPENEGEKRKRTRTIKTEVVQEPANLFQQAPEKVAEVEVKAEETPIVSEQKEQKPFVKPNKPNPRPNNPNQQRPGRNLLDEIRKPAETIPTKSYASSNFTSGTFCSCCGRRFC